jgi:hypothetical protein
MANRAKTQPGGININGDVNTGGGDIAARDIKKRDVIQSNSLSSVNTKTLFKPIYAQIQSQSDLSKDDKNDLVAAVEEIEQKVTEEKDYVDESFIERRLRNIARMAPDILDVVVKTLANPAIGLASIAQKIAQKAEKETPVKKNVKAA